MARQHEAYIKTILSLEFLAWFEMNKPEMGIDADIAKVQAWITFCEFIQIKENQLSISRRELAGFKQTGVFIRQVLNWLSQSDPKVVVDEPEPTAPSCKPVLSIALSSDEALRRKGIPQIEPSNFWQQWRFWSSPDVKFKVKSGHNESASEGVLHLQNWRDIRPYVRPFNAIILTDNYIFARENQIRSNIYGLLSAILPQRDLDIPLQILILTTELHPIVREHKQSPDRHKPLPKLDSRKPEDRIKIENALKEIHENLTEFIREELELEQVELGLVWRHNTLYHDRHLFTNNCLIKTGGSFDFFGEREGRLRRNVFADLEICPLTYVQSPANISNRKYYDDDLRRIKEHRDSRDSVWYGNVQSRLLEF